MGYTQIFAASEPKAIKFSEVKEGECFILKSDRERSNASFYVRGCIGVYTHFYDGSTVDNDLRSWSSSELVILVDVDVKVTIRG